MKLFNKQCTIDFEHHKFLTSQTAFEGCRTLKRKNYKTSSVPMVIVSKLKDASYSSRLHEILHDAFLPYRPLYTKEAFDATVVSIEVIANRINSSDYSVYGAFVDGELAGTVTSKLTESGDLYFMTMAVSPVFTGQGIGKELLKTLDEEARENNCRSISLDTYEPLTSAIRLYENCGFRRTGKSKEYSGIIVFEMRKEQLTPCSKLLD